MKREYIDLIEASAASPLTAKEIAIILGARTRGADCVTHLRACKILRIEVVGQMPRVPHRPGRPERLYRISHISGIGSGA